MSRLLDKFIFAARWMLYPINLGLLAALTVYIIHFLHDDYVFIVSSKGDLETLMVAILGFVDAFMVANLTIMIVQGSHQIFIRKFQIKDTMDSPQYLDHIDTGILKVKVAMSIASITLVQLLKDFVNLEKVDWTLETHRIIVHVITLASALVMAVIWKITKSR